MLDISVTFAVLKLEMSSEERFLQFQNMYDISVTSAVFKYLRPVISFKPVQSRQNSFNEVGVYVLKLSSKMTFSIVPIFIPQREHRLITV